MKPNKTIFFALLFLSNVLFASVPSAIPYQGRIIEGETNFNGTGYFKFALIDQNGISRWSNDGSSTNGNEPTGRVALTVNNGLFFVQLGDTNKNMLIIQSTIFTNSLKLRLWFSKSTIYTLMLPDQIIGTVGYSMISDKLSADANINLNSYGIKPSRLTVTSVGISSTNSYMQISGLSDMIIITNNPQIFYGFSGQVIFLQGTDDSKRVILRNGNGLRLTMGTGFCIGKFDTITFIYDNVSTNWIEIDRKDYAE